MTLHERVSAWPRRKRGYAFFATITVAFTVIYAVFRIAEPEITAPASFWLNVIEGVAVIFAVAIAITPPGQRWRTDP